MRWDQSYRSIKHLYSQLDSVTRYIFVSLLAQSRGLNARPTIDAKCEEISQFQSEFNGGVKPIDSYMWIYIVLTWESRYILSMLNKYWNNLIYDVFCSAIDSLLLISLAVVFINMLHDTWLTGDDKNVLSTLEDRFIPSDNNLAFITVIYSEIKLCW